MNGTGPTDLTQLAVDALGHGCPDNGLTFAIASQVFSTQVAIERFGSPEQRQSWLPRLCDGSALGAFAITEPDSASDARALAATAERRDDGADVLNGTKAHITPGSRADVTVVFASTNPAAGRWGLSAFLVPTDTDGVELVGNREKMGMRTTPFGNIAFHDADEVERDLRDAIGGLIYSGHIRHPTQHHRPAARCRVTGRYR